MITIFKIYESCSDYETLLNKLKHLLSSFCNYFDDYIITRESGYLSNHLTITEKSTSKLMFSVGVEDNNIIVAILNDYSISIFVILEKYILDKIEEYIFYSNFNTYRIIDKDINNVKFNFEEFKLKLEIQKYNL